MGISQIQMLGPRQEQHEQSAPKKDIWEKIMQGLQVAGAVTGIASNYETIQKYRSERQALDDAKKGILTGSDKANLMKSGFEVADQKAPGAQPFKFRNGLSDDDIETSYFTPPKKETTIKGTWKTVAGKDGKPVERWLEDGGPDQPAYTKPDEPKDDKTASNTMDLRKEYNNHPVTKATTIMAAANNKIQSTIKSENSDGASDISLVYSFMKMNDPDSAVREGEYATAENAGGVPSKIANLYNKVLKGERLTPELRQSFASQANVLMNSQLENQSIQDQRYSDLASKWKMDANYVIDPTFAKMRGAMQSAQNKTQTPSDGTAYAGPSVKPGQVDNGYEFLGGDPGDPKSWKKVGGK